jgi:hypothetical protein
VPEVDAAQTALPQNQEITMTDALRRWQEGVSTCGQMIQPEDIDEPLAAAIAGHYRHAVLILDACGIVRFATTRRLFGRSDQELPDVHLQSLIPTLPVRDSTPGYNVAYLRLTFADQGWQSHCAVSVDRGRFPVELSVRTLAMGRSYALLVAIREPYPVAHIASSALARNALLFDGAVAA